eukprot:11836028-Ditylum_brightwellii.AAC.1
MCVAKAVDQSATVTSTWHGSISPRFLGRGVKWEVASEPISQFLRSFAGPSEYSGPVIFAEKAVSMEKSGTD